METLLTIILIIVAAMWLLRLFLPYILRWLITRQTKRWQEQFGQQGASGNFSEQQTRSGASSNQEKQKQGEVTIKTRGASSKVVSKNVGESVDFEEIKD